MAIELADGRITRVAAGVGSPPPGAERLQGLVVPGFANAHSHAFQRALRGRTHDEGGSFWTWREQMYALANALNPESMFAVSRAAFGEMALAGVTLVGEFHYLHHALGGSPYPEANAMGAAVIEAARAAGLRLTLLDSCYLHGGIGRPPEERQLRFCDPSAEDWSTRVDELARSLPEDSPVRIGAAIHSVRAVDPASAAIVAAWAEERQAPLHAHLSEQPAENEACIETYGDTPAELLFQSGVLSERFTAVHATHVSESDVTRLATAGARCCLCPTTERDLADGIAPALQLRGAGVDLALGSDSNAVIEPLEEARAVELDERLSTGVRGRHSAPELLAAATRGGYDSLGWPGGGVIREGALADLVAFRLGGVRLSGTPAKDAVDGLLFAGAAADVSDVLVGGRFIVRDGEHVALDVARELRDSIGQLTW